MLAGDDHAAKSSTNAHQSEHILKACCIPVLNPSNVQDYLDLPLLVVDQREGRDRAGADAEHVPEPLGAGEGRGFIGKD